MRKDGRDLERAPDAETRHVGRRERGDVAPLIDDAPARRLQELGQQIEAGGLASAVRSDQRVNSTACDAQAHAVHRHKTGKFLGEVLGLEDDLGTHRRNASRVLHCPYVWSDRPASKTRATLFLLRTRWSVRFDQPCFPVPPGARRETLPATDVTGSAGGHVDALDGARRRLVVLELVVDLEPRSEE